ncbi:LADA_0C10506g1_1 [Lachancea dasiensis]|uniref:LADA_0C10506g1_1 n=1 Tax=Lachancea dasiensis TaxID=1072105 RepID=A0A1G4J124_9SACH|nr:LADA_0C10506g1_1 [Lachancea dasiensis]
MANKDQQLSHVKEFYCQYTNQLHKKHKSWHDGKLKYYQSTHKFQLYTIDDGILLGSGLVTNARRVERILDGSRFNKEEHKIFSQFLVMIDCLHCEYDKDIGGLANNGPRAFNMKEYPEGARDNSRDSRANTNLPKLKAYDSGSHHDRLALKVNQPFRRPKIEKDRAVGMKAFKEFKPLVLKEASRLQPERPSLALNMKRPNRKAAASDGTKKALPSSHVNGNNVSVRDERPKMTTPEMHFAVTEPPVHKIICQKSAPLEISSNIGEKRPPAEDGAPFKRAPFRIHQKTITIHHEPIQLG